MVAVAASAGIVIVLFLLVRLPPDSPPLPATAVRRPALGPVQVVRPVTTSDAVLKEEMELRDLRPLFLPTPYNAALPEPRLEASRSFLEDETSVTAAGDAERNIAEHLPPVVTLNGKALVGRAEDRAKVSDLLTDEGLGAAVGFGRTKRELAPLPARGGFVEVVRIATGDRVLGESLPAAARPPGDKPWEPIEFLADVDAAGLTAPLVVSSSSRIDEIDVHYRNYLARTYRIGERLPPGFYRVSVTP